MADSDLRNRKACTWNASLVLPGNDEALSRNIPWAFGSWQLLAKGITQDTGPDGCAYAVDLAENLADVHAGWSES